MKLLKYITLFIVFQMPINGICQSVYSYTLNFKNAEEFYAAGKYNDALAQLEVIKNTLEKGNSTDRLMTRLIFSQAEIEKVYTLLAQTYIEIGDEDKAKESLLKLLKESPNFKPGPLFQKDFYLLLNEIEVQPKVYAGFNIMLNKPVFKIKQVNSIYDSTNYAATYKSKLNYTYTGFLEWQFVNFLSLNAAYSYSKMSYKRELTSVATDQFNLKYNELIYANEGRLTLKKYFDNGDVQPFIGVGAALSNLRQVQGNAELNYLFTDRNTGVSKQKNITQNNIDIIKLRNKNRVGLNFNVGLTLKQKNIIIGLESRYILEFQNFNNQSNNQYNGVLANQYYYIDNDIKLRRFDFGISMAFILNYKIKLKAE
jgi:hypothetical protein